jgi:Cu-Zn family superoxide dismutase
MLMAARGEGARVHTLPAKDDKAFPENVGADPKTRFFYTGSLINGTVYRGSLDAKNVDVFLTPGSSGLKSAAGIKVDEQSRLWIIDSEGRVLVYDTGKKVKLHTFVLEGPGKSIVNDLTLSREFAYVTDSGRPFLYRLPVTLPANNPETTVRPWLTVDPPIFYAHAAIPFSINLNGIVASLDGKTLLTIQSDAGILYRVDVDKVEAGKPKEAITRVEISPKKRKIGTYYEDDPCAELYRFVMQIFSMNPLFCGDGLLLVDQYLHVARNITNEIVTLKLSDDYRSAELTLETKNDQFAFPTGLAKLGDRLLVTNSQLNRPEKPTLPFTIVNLALPLESGLSGTR